MKLQNIAALTTALVLILTDFASSPGRFRLRGQETEEETERQTMQHCTALCEPPDAVWRSIPWELDLLEAQRMAIETSQPIFIWSMDGHPLACT